MNDFFVKQKSKCRNCEIKRLSNSKKLNVSQEIKNPWILKNSDSKILVIQESPLDKDDQKLLIKFFEKYFKGKPFDILAGIECQIENSFPSGIYHIYSCCNTFPSDLSDSPYNVIITLGKAITAVTKTDDIKDWEEFAEFIFNPTYFYTPFDSKKRIRVYPFPYTDTFLGKDNFENFFVKKQFEFINKYLEGEIDTTSINYTLEKVTDIEDFYEKNKNQKYISIDTETNTLDVFSPYLKVKCITVSFDGETGYYIRREDIDVEKFSKFIKNKHQIWANGKYDVKVLHIMGITNLKIDDDVILFHHMLNTDRVKNSIKSLAWMLGFGFYDKELNSYLSLNPGITYYDIPEDIIFPYATLDAIVTFKLWKLGRQLSRKQSSVLEAYDIIKKSLEVFLDMEEKGINIDIQYMNKLNEELQVKLDALTSQIRTSLKEPGLDVNSNDQLARVLEKNKWPELGRTSKGLYNTADKQLSAWEKAGYTEASLLIKYRSYQKLKTSFVGEVEEEDSTVDHSYFFSEEKDKRVEGLAKSVSIDGKIHTTFWPGMTDSLRCISGDSFIETDKGKIKIKDLHNNFSEVKVLTHTLNYQKIINSFDNGIKKIFELKLKNGKILRLTEDHKILTNSGWKELKDINLKQDKVFGIK